MRTLSAALWSAAAVLPALAHATTPFPDPTDAAASVPAVTVLSAFDGDHPYSDEDTLDWRRLNQAATTARGMGGMKHGDMGGHNAMPMEGHGSGHGGGSQ
jgi:hypothetical protein